jgi:hypothetical protein
MSPLTDVSRQKRLSAAVLNEANNLIHNQSPDYDDLKLGAEPKRLKRKLMDETDFY